MSRCESIASVRSNGTFQSLRPSSGGAFLGVVLWVGEGDSQPVVRKGKGFVRQVVHCSPTNFIQKLVQTDFIVAIVFADQPLSTIRKLSNQARRTQYNMGLAPPVYAATVEGKVEENPAFQWCDVVAGLSQWGQLAETLYFKLAPRPPKTDVLWCDACASSSTMHAMAATLAKLGLNVEFFDDAEKLVRAATEDVAAIVTSGRGIPSLAKIREKLHEDRVRPLYWVVSLTAKTASAYDHGADAAIVCDNEDITLHKEHLNDVCRSQPWMWHVVIGDLVSVAQAIGVTGIGGTQWSLPKLYDDMTWRASNFPLLAARCTRVFAQLAEVDNYDMETVIVNPHMQVHEARFQAAKRTLRGYVRDRLVYHGTDEEIARLVLRTSFKPSGSGMYGPGVYCVDPVGLKKAAFFAMSERNARDRDDRTRRHQRPRGAIIALRVAMCHTRIVDATEWYHKKTPCVEGEDSLIGVCKAGYGSDEILNGIAEYVIRSPDLCHPVGMAVFKRR